MHDYATLNIQFGSQLAYEKYSKTSSSLAFDSDRSSYKTDWNSTRTINRSSTTNLSSFNEELLRQPIINMKCFVAIALFAMIAIAFAEDTKPVEAESIEPSNANNNPLEAEAARNKRGVLIGAAYTAPIAYTAPVAYTSAAAYAYPYAYTAAYSSYPYYAAGYSAPYIVA
ncbi:PREDICTED: uncharacterized protein LOC107065639 [Polistes dominula]|uniref:Uncharacterized protein LOC107065639 n=1 Tax=Polistes dominula TaxID=743375 RepID=A0ABM1I463_POLDO|nr:PREDICTED: uncharacterized protein LOC107065639 [Polistes dominula]